MIAALFIMVQWCPSVAEQMCKMWEAHTTGLLFSHKKGWQTNTCYKMDKPQKHYIQGKKSVTKDYILSFYWYEISRIVKSIETEGRLVVARGWGKAEIGRLLNGHRVSFGSDEGVWELVGVTAAQHWRRTKCHWVLHFKTVQIMLCAF